VEPVLGKTGREWSWETVEQYVGSLREAGPSENVATHVGHGTLRIAVMVFEDRPASTRELGRMKGLLEESLQAGAIGLSLGLMYAPGSYTPGEELAELCSVLPRYDGLLATHIRGEGNSLVPSIREVIRIAKRCGCPLQISHLKAAGRSNWDKVTEAMELVDDTRSRGLDVTCDVHPYTAGSTSLTTLLPPWALEGGISRILERLKAPASQERIKEELGDEHDGWDNLMASTGWDSLYISSLSKGQEAELEGKNIDEISELRGLEPANCMMDLLRGRRGCLGGRRFGVGVCTQGATLAVTLAFEGFGRAKGGHPGDQIRDIGCRRARPRRGRRVRAGRLRNPLGAVARKACREEMRRWASKT
jgi:N-acyl-D-amino-acid deacylase